MNRRGRPPPSRPPPFHQGVEEAGRRFRTQCGNAARRSWRYVARRTQHQETKDATSRITALRLPSTTDVGGGMGKTCDHVTEWTRIPIRPRPPLLRPPGDIIRCSRPIAEKVLLVIIGALILLIPYQVSATRGTCHQPAIGTSIP